MSFSIIAAIGKNRELGKDNQLLWHISEDLQFFKKTTMGHPILMGHRTFDSLPKLLPGRKHYVVTRNKELDTSSKAEFGAKAKPFATSEAVAPRAVGVGSPHPLAPCPEREAEEDVSSSIELVNNLSAFAKEHQETDEEIFVIGGGMVYWEMLKYTDKLYLTEVDAEFKDADTFFPEFDKQNYDRKVLGKGEDHDLAYEFVLYTKK